MNKIFILALFILSTKISTSQITPVAQLIQNKVQKGIKFKDVSILNEVIDVGKAAEIKKSLNSFTLTKIDREALKILIKNKSSEISFSFPYNRKKLVVDLVRVNILTDDFTLLTEKGNTIKYNPGLYYQGIIHNDLNSVAAFSFFDDEIIGIVSNNVNGNIVIGKLKNDSSNYISYSDKNLIEKSTFKCQSEEIFNSNKNFKNTIESKVLTNKCVGLYYEVDYDLFQSRNSSFNSTVNWITAIHNNVSTLYSNAEINVGLRQVFVWTSQDPYSGNSSLEQLEAFKQYRSVFNGDLAQLITMDPGGRGGIAYTNSLCNDNLKYGYSDVENFYDIVPTYSWTVYVVTHELGHGLGSEHTHECVWNGNNTAIDGCGPTYAPETRDFNCPIAPLPSSGGTIMSYCHLGSVGIDFSNGFGEQPKVRIQNRINNSSCLGTSCLSTLPPVSGADLTIINPQISSTTITAGNPFTVYFSENNDGQGSASPNYVSFHLSNDNILTPNNNGDFYVGEYQVTQTLAPLSQTIQLSKQIVIPANTPPGHYYLFFSADGSEIIDESNEQNNFATVEINVVQVAGCSTGLVSIPLSQTIAAPSGTNFSITATATDPNYQWQVNTGSGWVNLLNNSPYSGVYSTTLNISSTNLSMSGYRYRCAVSNQCGGIVNSESATLTVNTTNTSCNNDFACSPKPININAACIVTNCTTVGANPPTSDVIYKSCSNIPYQTGRYDDDVWFSITPANTNPVTVKVTATSNLSNFDPVLGIYTGACLSLAQITGGCSDNPQSVPEQITFTPVAGTTYLLRIFSYGIGSTYSGNFDICVTAAGASGSNPLPDLEPVNESFSTTSICPGGSFQLNFDVENNGDASAGSSVVKYYLSSDNSYSGDDLLLGSTTVNSIGSGNDISKTKTLNIPSGTSNGSWYVLIVADADNNVDEGSNGEGNNVYAKSISVSTCSLADIQLTYTGTPPTTGNVGVNIPVSFECTNIGGSITPPTRVGFYLSTDNIFDPKTDIYLDDEATNSLDPNETDADNSGINISNCLPCGTYFIIMVADYQNLVSESNRNNNIYVFPYTFTGCVACSVSVPATGMNFQSAGGTGVIPVTAYQCCPWAASTNDSWITITNGNGTGNGNVSYSIASCTGGSTRNGSITVNGQTYNVSQNCTESCNNSNSFSWAAQAGSSTYSEFAYDLVVDKPGNIYTTGSIQGSSTFGNGIVLTAPGSAPDVFVSKYNASGQIQWAVNYGNIGQDLGLRIAKDKNDNIYVAGYFTGSITFGNTTLTSNVPNDASAFIIKLNPDGTVQWAKKINPTGVAINTLIAIDNNDNIFVSGNFFGGPTSFFIAKYSIDGNQSWYREYNAGSIRGINVDNTGSILICGSFLGTITLGSVTLTAMATADGFVSKLDPAGNVIWANQLSSPSTAQNALTSVAVDTANNIYAVGNVDSNAIVGTIVIPLLKGSKAVIIKLDENGNPLWVKASIQGVQYSTKVIKARDKGIYFSGYFGNSFKMDSIALTAQGSNDAFIIRIDDNEKVEWIKGFGGSQADEAYTIGLNNNSDIFVAGGFSGSVSYGNTTLTSTGNIDIFLAKFKQCDPPVANISYTGNATVCPGQNLSLSANFCSTNSYQWFYNNTEIVGANNPAYTATQTGTYKVKISALPGCETLSDAVVLSSQTTYSFKGTGDWNNANNWSNNIIPPSVLPSCAEIIVNPQTGGECRLNVPQTISEGAKITVVTGSSFIVMGNLTINN